MATTTRSVQEASAVDYLVDEHAGRLDVPNDSRITPAEEYEESLGATGPSNWWLVGLIALGIVAAMLLGLQLLNGAPSTDVQPGSPTAVVPE